jgi:hypothetical protein
VLRIESSAIPVHVLVAEAQNAPRAVITVPAEGGAAFEYDDREVYVAIRRLGEAVAGTWKPLNWVVAKGGIEPPTQGFSVII